MITNGQAEKVPVTKRESQKATLMKLVNKRVNTLWQEVESEEKGEKDRRAQGQDASNSPDLNLLSRTDVCSLYWDYSKDSYEVYYMGQTIQGARPSSFQSIGNSYAKDSYDVYYMGKKIDGARPSTFQLIGKGYAKDSYDVYYMGKKVQGARPSSFQLIDKGYAKDSYDVYYMGKKVQGARPSSFTLIDGGYATDYDNIYCVNKE
ncbi:unnamed protein product [Rotaria sp. Silwood2]|nr:unnamed protein product [Rotaria sp. Silwood2]